VNERAGDGSVLAMRTEQAGKSGHLALVEIKMSQQID